MTKKTGKVSSASKGETSKGRRAFLKGSVAAAAAAPMVMTSRKTEAQAVPAPPASPPVTPWAEYLPEEGYAPMQEAELETYPTEEANTGAGECGRNPHVRWADLTYGKTLKTFRLSAGENPGWVFNPAYPPQKIWGWSADANPSPASYTTPGPLFHQYYGQPSIVRIANKLPQNHQGFGSPEISTHLHNGHTPSESDGFPGDFFSPIMKGPTLASPGQWRDHFYPNCYAGYDAYPYGVPECPQYSGPGDIREALGTMFYHDHTLDFTAPNVYRGLVGMSFMYDSIDTGNERDTSPYALRLPSGRYDYPLALADKRFGADKILTFDQLSPEGTLGDMVCVNGKIQPKLKVARRKYRFRILNGGVSRFYHLNLVNSALVRQTFTYIANDGNLLERPLLNQLDLPLGVAERADIVIDFKKYPKGTVLYLENRQRQTETRGPKIGDLTIRQQLLRFEVVDLPPGEEDVSQVPAYLRPLRPIDETEVSAVRRFRFNRTNGQWAINGNLFNVFQAIEIPCGSTEIWEFENGDNGWSHPIHVHFEEGRILSRRTQGVNVPVPAREMGRKDVFILPPGPDTLVRVLLRFRDFKGKYVMHCHNMIHEDHQMMIRWDIV